ncbi:MAG: hypothetical protein HYT09_01875 [Candidatus Levybacteria bacterium]|nr:hypothetical protein [Candidatus Levybacteria bacterium]
MILENGKSFGVFEDPSWREVNSYSYFLAEMVRKSGFNPEGIIGIQKGGIFPAVFLSYRLGGIPLASIEVAKDGDIRRVVPNPNVNWQGLNGRRFLLVEDVLETGRSAQAGMDFLKDSGAEVRLACFFTRPQTEIEPDFVLARNVEIPVIFPWEIDQPYA